MDLKKLQEFGTLQNYKRGHVLFQAGDPDTNLYIILKGAVSVRNTAGGRLENEVLEAGKFFGELSVILDIPKPNTCVIEENDTALMSIPRTKFEDFLKEDQGFSVRIMRLLAERRLEAIKERDEMAVQLSRYEPASKQAMPLDMYAPLTPEKKTPAKPAAAESGTAGSGANVKANTQTGGKPGEPRDNTLSGTIPVQTAAKPDPPKAPAQNLPAGMDVMRTLNIVPPEHKVYTSMEWPEAHTALTPKALTCPICEKKFNTTYLSRSRMGIAKTDSDMRKRYRIIEPMYFELYTCTHCGYSNFSEEFEKLNRGLKEEVRKVITVINKLPADIETDIFNINYVFLKLYLIILCYQGTREGVAVIPKIWLRLSWLYEDVGDEQLQTYATEQAYNAYMEAFYKTKSYTGEAENEVLLLMGELALRLGKEKEALKHFMDVLMSGMPTNVQRSRADNRVYDIRHKGEKAEAEQEA